MKKYTRKDNIIKKFSQSVMHLCFVNIFSGSSHNRSDDEPLIKAARHPQVTKILRIILERCDGEETGSARSLNKTSAGTDYITKFLLMP